MIGGVHIDPVWQWPWQSGAEEAVAVDEICGSTADIAKARGWTLWDEVNILEDRLGAASLRISPFMLRDWRIEQVR